MKTSMRFFMLCCALFAASAQAQVTITGDGTMQGDFTIGIVLTNASSFGMQCGNGDTADCKGSNFIVWPNTDAQPGLLRLHDAGTHWAAMNPASGQYYWPTLDAWLDLIAQHQPVAVSQVFTWVPCWDALTCSAPPTQLNGTNAPPKDLTPAGSQSFNAFVTAFVQHCSRAGNCVAKYVKYYEMWNEWNLSFHWTGTMAQVYQMVAPAAAIIRANVPNAVILMPSSTPASDTGLGYLTDFNNWLNYETANGRISDWVDWHNYLTVTSYTTQTPEAAWTSANANYISAQKANPQWATAPWADTETNFNGAPPPGLNYTCPTSLNPNPPKTYSAEDCTGQVARWQILHDSNGSSGLYWYKWRETIGLVPSYENAYYWVMQYTVGGRYTAPASFTTTGGIQVWTAPLIESNGTAALWVWTPSESGTTFTVPAGFTDSCDLSGGDTAVSSGQQITIGPMPILLEK